MKSIHRSISLYGILPIIDPHEINAPIMVNLGLLKEGGGGAVYCYENWTQENTLIKI